MFETQPKTSMTDWLVEEMLGRIKSGQWKSGDKIPSERNLIEEFKVSRLSLRESLARLRALGILEIKHGKGSTVRRMDAEILGRLFPLMVSLEGERSFEHIFEMRISIESETAYLAAERRSQEDMDKIDKELDLFQKAVDGSEDSVNHDLAFHVCIAEATGNPLFPLLLKSFSGFVTYVQNLSCHNDRNLQSSALEYHTSLAQAIREGNPDLARSIMIEHLKTSAERIRNSGVLSNGNGVASETTQSASA
jgi:DNA-binding FadR family transcriptional regulator